MVEFYINLFEQEDYVGTNRPHYKVLFKLDGIEHECAFWPAKEGKKGYVGKAKPRQPRSDKPKETAETIVEEIKKEFPNAEIKRPF